MSTTRNVLITGASGGVGRALTKALDGAGWRVFAGVRSPEAAAAVEELDPDATALQLDITDGESIRQAAEIVASQAFQTNGAAEEQTAGAGA